MPISLQCPGCGKKYRLRDAWAGKRVQCRCGTQTTVPAPGADAAASSGEFQLDEQPPQPVPSGPPANPPPSTLPRDKEAIGPAPARRPGWRTRQPWASDKWRGTIGVLSVFYGSVMVPFVLISGLWFWPVGFVKLITQLVLAVMIAVGGVLILRGHKHGPACAGLSCVLLCFFRVWFLLLGLLSALSTGELRGFAFILAGTVLLYSIPVLITVWCLKQELAKEAEGEPPL
jgi:hypothetical protein